MNVYLIVSRWNRFEVLCYLIVGIQASGISRVIETYRNSGIEIPEAWIPTIKKHNSRSATKQTCEGTTSNSRNNNED